MVGHKATVKLPNPLLLPIEVDSPFSLVPTVCLWTWSLLRASLASPVFERVWGTMISRRRLEHDYCTDTRLLSLGWQAQAHSNGVAPTRPRKFALRQRSLLLSHACARACARLRSRSCLCLALALSLVLCVSLSVSPSLCILFSPASLLLWRVARLSFSFSLSPAPSRPSKRGRVFP